PRPRGRVDRARAGAADQGCEGPASGCCHRWRRRRLCRRRYSVLEQGLSAMSEHWYDRQGKPCYEQPTQKGGLRATNLRDARKLGLVPSVTTVLSVIDKPALGTWKVKQGILAALTLPRQPDESEDAWLARILTDSGEQAKAAAEEGTRIHDQCERALKGLSVIEDYRPHVEGVKACLAELFPDVTDWVPEQSFAHPLGYGGKVDLHSP